jgi:hemoglobin/transferrin/lactoferrin receptor protein
MRTFSALVLMAALSVASPVSAATISGVVSDITGAALTMARVTLRSISTGQEVVVETDAQGRYRFDVPASGTYLVIVNRAGFAEAARTVTVEQPDAELDVPVSLELGGMSTEVSVTASRGEREVRQIPLHVETMTRAGLDSTRMLVLVDGERLNTARQATDRTGAEVGLVSTDTISRVEIINGAGTLMYGSDALAGTVNIITNEPTFTPTAQLLYGFNGFYSSNENGMRGTATFGGTSPSATFRVQAGAEKYDNYEAGSFDIEDTRPLFADGTLRQADTIDNNFGFNFRAFPDPFNMPFVRTDGEIMNSQAEGKFVNATGLFKVGERRSVRVRYNSRRMKDIGFPDFEQPFFFNDTSLPHSNHDKISARYEAQAVTPWLANVSLSAYYQRLERLLRTTLPVQFPAPTPVTFFPISVMRLDVVSDTEQRVWTPGIDLNAVFVPGQNHLLTAGLTFYRDRSIDARTTSTTTSMVGQVAMGARGPAPIVFPSPVQLGPPTIANPVRVPDASLRNIALFAQDEWRVRPTLSVIAGVRGDFYTVVTEPTPGYDVQSIIGNATPPIDQAKLPDPNGATYSRQALTGDIGIVSNADGAVNPFLRYGRSYRHPNLEEMLFAGPATTGSLVPNVTLEPETGNNLDLGVKFRAGRLSGGAYYFLNHYQNFIAQDLVVATNSSGALAQSRNFGNVRITGVELSAATPITLRPGVITLTGAAAFTRGTIIEGTNPLDNSSLAGTPFDNITPLKVIAATRFTQARGWWWVEYGVRAQTEVTRVAETLLDSPFLIAQDLLALDGFAVHRLGWGVNLARGRDRLNLTFAIENLGDKYYREHFQFAPARGRSFTVGLNVGAF